MPCELCRDGFPDKGVSGDQLVELAPRTSKSGVSKDQGLRREPYLMPTAYFTHLGHVFASVQTLTCIDISVPVLQTIELTRSY